MAAAMAAGAAASALASDRLAAGPQTVASSVTTPLERQFGEIPGLSQMTSSSAVEYTQITLQFDRSRTVDSAAQDVQAAINAAAANLPPTLLNPPIYRKTNPADTPILLLALTSDTLPLTKVSKFSMITDRSEVTNTIRAAKAET
jgi:multidrug efflux pump subunit AcrB